MIPSATNAICQVATAPQIPCLKLECRLPTDFDGADVDFDVADADAAEARLEVA